VVLINMGTSSDSSLHHGFATISVPVESVMDTIALGHVYVSIFRFTLVTAHDRLPRTQSVIILTKNTVKREFSRRHILVATHD